MRGTEIIYYSMVSTATLKKKPKGNAKFIPIMRMFEVFNADQIEGTEKITKYLYHEKDVTGVDFAKADKLIKSSKAVIRHTGQQAFYVPPRLAKDGNQIGGDYIQMPRPGYFDGVAEYYETLFHEMVHWTEHPKRCNWIRKDKNDYAPGELIAELGACFLCAELGIPTSENLLERSQGYLQHWLQNMNENPHYLFQSAKQASKAVDFLLAFVKKPKKKKKVVAS
jgi:antirestriction protein ArdC